MTPRFKTIYKEQVLPNLAEKLNYQNCHQLPKLEKIQLNRGLGLSAQNSNILKKSIEEFRAITGQKPIITKAKKSNAGFKIREEMDLGLTVTLRSDKMYDFLDKFINITLPQVRDFKGLSSKSFDRDGNYSLAIKEQLIFPEINYEDVDQIRGLDITIVTTGNNKADSKALLSEFGFPFND
jgi:large subunit ribosomal protein L5